MKLALAPETAELVENAGEAAEFLKKLAHPSRLMIVCALVDGMLLDQLSAPSDVVDAPAPRCHREAGAAGGRASASSRPARVCRTLTSSLSPTDRSACHLSVRAADADAGCRATVSTAAMASERTGMRR